MYNAADSWNPTPKEDGGGNNFIMPWANLKNFFVSYPPAG